MRSRVDREIPEDVVYQILVFVISVKSLCRWRCVCKSWSSIISSPQFREDHDRRSQENPNPLLFTVHKPKRHGSVHDLRTYTVDQGSLVDQFSTCIPHPDNCRKILIIQSCLGLLCLASRYTNNIRIYNPLIKLLLTLPPASSGRNVCVGFGFTSTSRTFKVVRVFSPTDYPASLGCEVFTLGSQAWREVKNPPYPASFGGMPLLHGSLHMMPHHQFCAQEPTHYIAAFNVDTEDYRHIPLPESHRSFVTSHPVSRFEQTCLTELRGSLCLTFNFGLTERGIELWFLEDYQNARWVIGYNINLTSLVGVRSDMPDIWVRPIRVLGRETILFNVLDAELKYYNHNIGVVTREIYNASPAACYTETLLSLKFSQRMTTYFKLSLGTVGGKRKAELLDPGQIGSILDYGNGRSNVQECVQANQDYVAAEKNKLHCEVHQLESELLHHRCSLDEFPALCSRIYELERSNAELRDKLNIFRQSSTEHDIEAQPSQEPVKHQVKFLGVGRRLCDESTSGPAEEPVKHHVRFPGVGRRLCDESTSGLAEEPVKRQAKFVGVGRRLNG